MGHVNYCYKLTIMILSGLIAAVLIYQFADQILSKEHSDTKTLILAIAGITLAILVFIGAAIESAFLCQIAFVVLTVAFIIQLINLIVLIIDGATTSVLISSSIVLIIYGVLSFIVHEFIAQCS